MTTTTTKMRADQLIADEFGVNADYVSELLEQFERDPSSVDEEWRSVFDELLNNGRVTTDSPTSSPLSTQKAPAPVQQGPGVIQSTYDWGKEGDGAKVQQSDSATEAHAPEPAREAASAT